MTFKKPSSVANQTGAYSYKGGITSSTQNYIDNSFPNMLDKTGDNAGSGGGISGNLEFLSGSTLTFDSGSTLAGTVTSATTTAITLTNFSSITLANISAIFVNSGSQIQYNGASSGSTYFTGTSQVMGNGSTLEVQSGGALLADDGSTVTLSGIVDFSSTGGNSGLFQITTSTTGGSQFKVQAQSSTHAGSGGGTLALNAGSGPVFNGAVQLGDAAGNINLAITNVEARFYSSAGVFGIGSPLVLFPFGGSANTQIGNETWLPVFVSTAASGSNVLVASINVPNDTMVFCEFKWCRRDLVGGTSSSGWGANSGSFTAIANGSGVITHSAPQQVFSATHYDSISGVTITSAANNVSLYAVAQTDADDWQFLVRIMAC